LDLAERGRMRNLLRELQRLEGEHPQVKPWIGQVRALAQRFHIDKLREVLGGRPMPSRDLDL
jgi:hypothetical protein